MKQKDKRILVISDMHMPYHHPDSFKFLMAVKRKYKPTRIINIGDEVDNHGISFHDSDPDILSPGDELLEAQKCCKQLHKIFPKMELVDSNHGSLAYRRAKAGGIPRHFIKDYADVLEIKSGWTWHDEILISVHPRQDILFRHQFQASVLKAAEQMGCSCVQGHYHSKFEIAYTSSPRSLNWGMSVGCLIDHKALAFEYNKLQLKRPILGIGFIHRGIPELIPMYLDGEGNWVGKVY